MGDDESALEPLVDPLEDQDSLALEDSPKVEEASAAVLISPFLEESGVDESAL
jgi:hypothetical protein